MSKYFTPLNLKKFEVTTENITSKEVTKELLGSVQWLKENQTIYYETKFNDLANLILDKEQTLKGSLNSLGRKLNVEVITPAEYQPYNKSEMFRTSILTKMGGYLQNEILVNIINTIPDPSVKNVIAEYKKNYGHATTPTYQFMKRTIERVLGTGVIHSLPKADGVLPFWATDTHYAKVTNDKKNIYFTFKMPTRGSVTLKFSIPNGERFQGEKVTRPNVYIKNGQLTFGFTVQHSLPPKQKSVNYLGVDLGIIAPFVGTVISPTNNSYTPNFMPNKKINLISKKIKKLGFLSNKLWVKEEINVIKSHSETTDQARKAELLKIERLRIRSKISRLKNERAHHVANQIISIALQYNANIILENLDWVPNSKWEQAVQQNNLEHKANRQGLTIRKVNPAYTTRKCPTCNELITIKGRVTHCSSCRSNLNRDILASRNIALRALPGKVKPSFSRFTQSLQTRVTKPVTTGDNITDYVPSYFYVRNTT